MTSPRRNRREPHPGGDPLQGDRCRARRRTGSSRATTASWRSMGIVAPSYATSPAAPAMSAGRHPARRAAVALAVGAGRLRWRSHDPTSAGRLRLTVLGCSSAAAARRLAGGRVPRGLGRHDDHARCRPGHGPTAPAAHGPDRPRRAGHRAHARRPLPRRRRAALPVPVGRAGAATVARPPAAWCP